MELRKKKNINRGWLSSLYAWSPVLLLLMIGFQNSTNAQTKFQIDVGDWHVPNHWAPFGIPTINDSVYLISNMNILPDSTAFARYLQIEPSGILTIERDLNANKPGRLTVANTSGNAIKNSGTIHQGGRLSITQAQDTAIINLGTLHIEEHARIFLKSIPAELAIYNQGTFRISGNMEINDLDSTIDQAILNMDTFLLDTSGNISISNINDRGIFNDGYFSCFGDIDVRHNGDWAISNNNLFILDTGMIILDTIHSGIVNSDVFENRLNGLIKIGYTTFNFAFYNNKSGPNIGSPFFYNYGQLHIEDVPAKSFITHIASKIFNAGTLTLKDKYSSSTGAITTPPIGLENKGLFVNLANGSIQIDSLTCDALINQDSFINQGSLIINEVEAMGIVNSGTFINEDSLIISFVDSTAIQNQINASFENQAFVRIDSASQHGIDNEGFWSNNSELRMRRLGDYGIFNKYIFSNTDSGFITIQSLNQASNVGLFNAELEDTISNQGTIVCRNIRGNGINNFGTFINGDSFSLQNINLHALVNTGKFDNLFGANLIIEDSTIYKANTGIYNYGDFNNHGMTEIKECGLGFYNIDFGTPSTTGIVTNLQTIYIQGTEFGLSNGSIWYNQPGSILTISNVSDIPFESSLESIFDGMGEVDVQNE